jgi:hypothetical protein
MRRRTFLAGLALPLVVAVRGRAVESAGRRLDFVVEDGFGGAGAADIEAVCRSAGESIWKHCPDTRWETRGFRIYHNDPYPITLDEHRDGFLAIGLTPKGTFWAQFAYQFAHEFGHALAGHSNDFEKIRGRDCGKNHWLEETLCEVASLFALRAMGETWKTKPPYPNWKSFAPHLTSYAQDRIDESQKSLKGEAFPTWFRANETSMRDKSTIREKNNIVALQLLPLFEAEPAGWESLPWFRRGRADRDASLADHLSAWRTACPERLRGFVTKIAECLR